MPYCHKCGTQAPPEAVYCNVCGTKLVQTAREEFSVSGDDVIKKVKQLIHEGNVTRIIVKNEKGDVLFVMPATVGVVGAILAPWMAALGVIASLATRCTIVVERVGDGKGQPQG